MYNEELEKAMLYYIIFEQEQYSLDEDDFGSERNKKIIKAINELKAENKDISIFYVQAKIKANGKQVLEYLATLGEYIHISNSENVYNEIIQLSKKRKLLKLLKEKLIEFQDCENVDIDILAEETIKAINKIEQINEKNKTFTEQVVDTINDLENNFNNQNDYSLYTGMLDLDHKTCGLHKQELTIIGARPRSWKNNICTSNCYTYSRERKESCDN